MTGVDTFFHVYLGNPGRLAYRWKELVEAVQAILAPGLPARPNRRLRVQSTMAAPMLMRGEVLVYVVQSQHSSVVARRFNVDVAASRAGYTVVSEIDGAASEAYIAGTTGPTALALVICHEILHNKVPWKAEVLHRRGGLSGSPPKTPTAGDYELLRSYLTTPGKQWLEGFK